MATELITQMSQALSIADKAVTGDPGSQAKMLELINRIEEVGDQYLRPHRVIGQGQEKTLFFLRTRLFSNGFELRSTDWSSHPPGQKVILGDMRVHFFRRMFINREGFGVLSIPGQVEGQMSPDLSEKNQARFEYLAGWYDSWVKKRAQPIHEAIQDILQSRTFLPKPKKIAWYGSMVSVTTSKPDIALLPPEYEDEIQYWKSWVRFGVEDSLKPGSEYFGLSQFPRSDALAAEAYTMWNLSTQAYITFRPNLQVLAQLIQTNRLPDSLPELDKLT